MGSSTDSLGRIVALRLEGTTEPAARGTAVLRFLRDSGQVCYRLRVENVTLPTVAAHIHCGEAGVNGAVVVATAAPRTDGNASGCASAATATIDEIVGNLRGFYVNVHTKEQSGGRPPRAARLTRSPAGARTRVPRGHRSGQSLATSPVGQETPVPPSPQYPFGFFARYCWWYGSA